jgi:hypothetical protein
MHTTVENREGSNNLGRSEKGILMIQLRAI